VAGHCRRRWRGRWRRPHRIMTPPSPFARRWRWRRRWRRSTFDDATLSLYSILLIGSFARVSFDGVCERLRRGKVLRSLEHVVEAALKGLCCGRNASSSSVVAITLLLTDPAAPAVAVLVQGVSSLRRSGCVLTPAIATVSAPCRTVLAI